MLMLGDLLAAARKSSSGLQSWLAVSDPELSGKVASAAAHEGVSPSAYARIAVADFTRRASEEDWATLTSSLRDSADPGTTCLLAMVHWRLTVSCCDAHSHASAGPGERNS
jgi:hypothetical protein